jgi:hypothetical protein
MRGEIYFIEIEEIIDQENNEAEMQKMVFSNLKGVKDVHKKVIMDWMEQKIYDCNQNQVIVPIIGLKHHRMVDKGLEKIFMKFDEASKMANSLCPNCELDEKYMEVFIEFITKKPQIHIGETVCSKIKPDNVRRTMQDENKLKNRTLNTIKLSNGEEIIT